MPHLHAQAGFPIGYVETKIRGLLPEEDPRSYKHSNDGRPSAEHDGDDAQELQRQGHYPALGSDALQDVIHQLEMGMKRPGHDRQD